MQHTRKLKYQDQKLFSCVWDRPLNWQTQHRNFNNIQRFSVEISMLCVCQIELDPTDMKRVSSPDRLILVVPEQHKTIHVFPMKGLQLNYLNSVFLKFSSRIIHVTIIRDENRRNLIFFSFPSSNEHRIEQK